MNRYFRVLLLLSAGIIVWWGPKVALAVEFPVEGRVTAVSKLPDPKQIDYPDCNYSVTFELFAGDDISLTERFVVVVPGIRKQQRTAWAALRKGEKYRLTLVDENELQDSEKSIQIVDDNDDFDLHYFYLKAAKKIAAFSLPGALPKQVTATDVKKLQELPEDEEARRKFIADELERVEAMIARYDSKRTEQVVALLSAQNKDNPLALLYTVDGREKLTLLWEDAKYLRSVFTPSSREIGDSVVASICSIRDFLHDAALG